MTEDIKPTEDKSMDPIVISSLTALAINVVNLALKYNDPNLKAPTVEAVRQHLESFKILADLPEAYDEAFVDNVMNHIKDYFDLK